MTFACLCCGYVTLEEQPPGTFDICPVCRWEDDFVEGPEDEAARGANGVSLAQARRNFVDFGASERRFVDSVREPLPVEIRDLVPPTIDGDTRGPCRNSLDD